MWKPGGKVLGTPVGKEGGGGGGIMTDEPLFITEDVAEKLWTETKHPNTQDKT